ncbi:GNAT family N-acetyltransferase [Paludisphaera mucosa]|uniref:GNAT family N-acetyltransferase n=1 Tax=Paludisphaera mucosa TaxID=3030827 RepID=A0ABT6FGV1_9BACT|nr:GNAT family N-acetyltransferase [Paludisphaera mucosa]MDG3006813.1 GNAT family N-acetyltransferase [Paludisphaera mucosa]
MNRFHVERMPRPELDLAIEAAAREGWNPGLHDAECFWAIDPTGFFMGVMDGRVVGRASAVAYDDRFAFVGLYIVAPEFRGLGYGMAITQALMRHVGDRNAGLDGVTSMVEKYGRLGYRPAHRSIRHVYTPRQALDPDGRIVDAESVDFERLADYDARHFSAPRPTFLARWIAQPGATALAFVEDGEIGGYGVIRPCRTGFKIGPLFAEDERAADALFAALGNHGLGGPVYLDVPEPNRDGMALAGRYGMTPEFECVRMYLRGDPGLPLDRIYGITAFEIG